MPQKNVRGRGLDSIGDCVYPSMKRLKHYNKTGKEISIATVNCSSGIMSTNSETTKTRTQKWKEKQLYGYFKRKTGEIAHKKAGIR